MRRGWAIAAIAAALLFQFTGLDQGIEMLAHRGRRTKTEMVLHLAHRGRRAGQDAIQHEVVQALTPILTGWVLGMPPVLPHDWAAWHAACVQAPFMAHSTTAE